MIISRQTQLHTAYRHISVCVWSSMCVCACSSPCEDVHRPLGFTSYLAVILPSSRSVLLPPIPHVPVVQTILHTFLIPHHVFALLFSSFSFCPTSSLSSFFPVIVLSSSSPSPSGVMFWHLFPSDERDRNLRNIVDPTFPPQQVIWMQSG